MKKVISIIFAILISFSIMSCDNEPVSNDVYVTVYPLKYIIETIFFGTEYTVGIVPGVTSHENSIDWSPKEIIAMTEAQYLFYVGGNYDQYIDYQINSLFIDKDVELVKIEDETNYIQFIDGVLHVHEDEEPDLSSLGVDPHFWISPYRLLQAAHLIYDKLLLKFTNQVYFMEDNYNLLITDLTKLSSAFSDAIENSEKTIMTSTNIYGYLREDYGLNFISISPGYHEEAEQFTSQEKEDIVNEAINYDIQYIIYEKYTTSPLSNAVFDELVDLNMDPQKLEFSILQSLSAEDAQEGNNYITIMYNNLELIKLALGYEAE